MSGYYRERQYKATIRCRDGGRKTGLLASLPRAAQPDSRRRLLRRQGAWLQGCRRSRFDCAIENGRIDTL